METSHSPFPPSSMDKIVACSAYLSMIEGVVDEETEEQREGTAAHWVASSMLKERIDYKPELKESKIKDVHYVGQKAPNGVIITEEMYDAALTFYNDVMKVAGKGYIQKLHVEEPVAMPQIHALCWGTPDCWLFIPETLTLYVWDFKYGHKKVKVQNNFQLLSYDLGILNRDDVLGYEKNLHDFGITIVNIIVQPRNYTGDGPISTDTFKAIDLRASVNIMNLACHMSEMPDKRQCVTGPHCIGCAARFKCKALALSNMLIIDYVTSGIPLEMTNEGMAYEMQLLEHAKFLLGQRMEAVEQQIQSKLRAGERVGGYELKQGYTINKWRIPDSQVLEMGKLFGVNLQKENVALSPHQAIQLMNREGMSPEALEGFYGRDKTSMKLGYDDGSKAKQIFSQEKI